MTNPDTIDDLAAARTLADTATRLRTEIARVIVGQDAAIEQILIALFCRGHCLVQGVPGLAKTTLISTLAQVLDLRFSRIQFTPDLMPSDITGSDILQEDPQTGRRRFESQPGPISATLLLADEINRAPPKSQAALLQAMQERHVTAGGQTLPLPDPFFVLATQNPIEQEGTYPLPEAQLDRFMFMVLIKYPPREDELEILRRSTMTEPPTLSRLIGPAELLAYQKLVHRVPVGDHAYHFALDLIRSTRPDEPGASDFVRTWLSWGAGPRAGQHLLAAARARALLHGRTHVMIEDIESVAPAALRHRLVPNFSAAAEGVSVDQIIDRLLSLIPRDEGERLL